MRKLFVSVLAMMLLLSGCSNSGNGGSGNQGGNESETISSADYTTFSSTGLENMDYLVTYRASDHEYNALLVDGLVDYDRFGLIQSSMAESWESSEGGLVWTFKLREGVQWVTSDGEPYAEVTAEDFVTGLKHAYGFDSGMASVLNGILKGVTEYLSGTGTLDGLGVEAVDKYTVKYTMETPCSFFPSIATYALLYPVNQSFLESKGAGCSLTNPDPSTCSFGDGTPGSILYNGAYVLTSNVAQSEVKFTKNTSYYDADRVYINNIAYYYDDGSDTTAIFNAVDAGTYTGMSLPASNEAVLTAAREKYADSIYTSQTGGSTYWGAFNFNRRAYDYEGGVVSPKTDAEKADTKVAILNTNFRRAVMYAFDRAAMNAQSRGVDLAEVTLRNMICEPDFVITSEGKQYSDLVSAELKEMGSELAGADLTDGHDAFFNKDLATKYANLAKQELTGKVSSFPIKMDIFYYGNSQSQANQASAFKQSIEAAIGDLVEVNLIVCQTTNEYYYSGYYAELGEQANYDFFYGAGWGPDYADPQTYLAIFDPYTGDMLSNFGLNPQGLEDEGDKNAKEVTGLNDFHNMLQAAMAETTDTDKRYQLFAEAEAWLIDNAIIVPNTTAGGAYAINRVRPWSAATFPVGLSSYKMRDVIVEDHIVTLEERAEFKKQWEADRAEAIANYTH
ncbi:MAG: peptide ABC transporter substrate-binding protein [Erysipelotrichales bacterium]|nr:peptide ABC transporter substrate-binding protein [Erysipelotrichales bacterium]